MPDQPSEWLPPGLIVRGDRRQIARCFAALAPLQPVAWIDDGLVCAPRAAGEIAGPALAVCPLPVSPTPDVPGWPDPPAEMLGGWYRRSPGHAPAPEGVRELVLTPGDGFGHIAHPTTAMCLGALAGLPGAPALDLGCGAGLLAQAWRRLGRGPVRGADLDPRAVAQACASLEAAGLAGDAQLQVGPAERLAELADGCVVFANVPRAVHDRLLERITGVPRAAVLSGLRPGEGRAVAAGYAARGLRARRVTRRGGWECWVMAR